MVRKVHKGFNISINYRIPRKSKKGYVGSKCHSTEFRCGEKDKKLAYLTYYDWIKEYKEKYGKKEITAYYVNLYPIISYYVTCPRCGGDAEILTWMIGASFGEGTENCESHNIICGHCPEVKNPEDALYNTVGFCYKILMKSEEELRTFEEHHTAGVKWEDWPNYSNLIKG
jgi:RecJ-like exonuclease